MSGELINDFQGMLKVAIVSGGYSSEYEISIQSGETVYANLDKSHYDTYQVIIDPDKWFLKRENGDEIVLNKEDFTADLDGETLHFDYVFIAIHGDPGENGLLQDYLDNLNIPYSASGASTSKLAFDKGACKAYFEDTEVKLAASVLIHKGDDIDNAAVLDKVGLPCFVKPNNGGSSCGISKVKEEGELSAALDLAFEEDEAVLIEQFIDGREITCGVFQENGQPRSLGVTEIITENEFFDYEAKYTEGKADEITPADVSVEITNECERLSIYMYRHLNC
ncbi:MAG: ATP-grasp domain-containing protein, partial [Flavobacteriales bacterium]|nr:ATP-grasp domain-containing protein [Flavobacteriales bacterium]